VALTPNDIHNKEFHRGFRGYAENEVDEFLDEVVREFEVLLRERQELRLQAEEAEQRLSRFQELEEHLQRALVVAQQTADEVRQNAQREAELITREAQQRAEQLMDEARAQLKILEHDLLERRRELDVWKAKVRSLLESELALLADEGGSTAAATREE
jgi:cell division initiation protein